MSQELTAIVRAARALIFDCDGVLVDREPISNRVFCELLAEAGVSMTVEQSTRTYVGMTLPMIVARVRSDHGDAAADLVERELTRRIVAAFERELRPMPDIDRVLERSPQPRAVASSSNLDRLFGAIRCADLGRWFGEHIYSAVMVAHPKPAPDLFLLAAERLGVRPSECVVFEDSSAGVRAAVAAGMTPIGFVGGGHALPDLGERLRGLGCVGVLGSWSELSL